VAAQPWSTHDEEFPPQVRDRRGGRPLRLAVQREEPVRRCFWMTSSVGLLVALYGVLVLSQLM
jgi:hypothetical protein